MSSLNPEQLVILYSKYSPQCSRVIEEIKHSLVSSSSTKLICIDNVSVREKLLASTSFQVKTVPSVLFLDSTGKVEVFEGPTVSDWLLAQFVSPKAIVEDAPQKEVSSPNVPGNAPSNDFPSNVSFLGEDASLSPPSSLATPIGPIMPNGMASGMANGMPNGMPAPNAKSAKLSDIAAEMAAGRALIDEEEKRNLPIPQTQFQR